MKKDEKFFVGFNITERCLRGVLYHISALKKRNVTARHPDKWVMFFVVLLIFYAPPILCSCSP